MAETYTDSEGGSYRTVCHSCKALKPVFVCKGCSQGTYCNAVCQKAHWDSGHKEECKSFRRGAAIAAAAGVSLPDKVCFDGSSPGGLKFLEAKREAEAALRVLEHSFGVERSNALDIINDGMVGAPPVPAHLSHAQRVKRYAEALRLYDDCTNPVFNTNLNHLMRAAHRNLTPKEYDVFARYLKHERIGSFNR
jgi:hypothetical protein